MTVQFTVTVTVPDDKLGPDGLIVGSEEYGPTARTPQFGVTWGESERESVEHFAARMLVAYTASSLPGVRADVRLKK